VIYLRKSAPRWYYLSIFGWQPFARFGASGWVYLNWRWLKERA
jgi:hypothetical protein